ncbi:MAG: 2-isopropylmalate synthase [Cellvibrionales bacterium]|nr:2-isopropylmalate synthase [Cellvibrionales bacterium]
MSKDKLVIFDTTLRDGEQSPGASMTKDEKIRIALMLEKMGVDVIEAGFAMASPGDFDAVKSVAETVKDSRICSLSRANRKDIERAGEALKYANASRIHTFIATSPIHMQYKLRMTPEQVVERAVDAVTFAQNFTDDVEFSCEDASRTEFDFMCHIVEKVIAAGARTINLPDTVGYGEPYQFGKVIGKLINNVPNADKAVFSIHCHNDLGLAVANSLSAVQNGARQVECTINGLGERAGNASLEEIVMAVHTRSDVFDVTTNINTQHIVPASRLVSSITGFPVQPNKAIVGANAFAHEAGIHQDGVLKHRETYEIMRAQDVGWGENRLVLGKHSGRAAFVSRLETIGHKCTSDEELDTLFARFKLLADKKHEIFDDDLQALLTIDSQERDTEGYQLAHFQAALASGSDPKVALDISLNGEIYKAEETGDGLVDAAFKAIESIVKSQAELVLYSVNSLTEGTDSFGEVTVRLKRDGRIVNGQGSDTDIIVASVKSYLHAVNLLNQSQRAHPQEGI